ncbi:ABC transporter permease [Solibacillus sp. FSL K6-1781]|uniref:ABC-type dipeptide/oligopeptide/nickel transport systems, permease component n=2 Tax=Solibacillus TaxID=648800 RepID=F2F8S3_SOLSS|nr:MULTISPECIES: ABC transporter permease [Solibacillus]AMO86966.1 diguanylate cyclase [Solibacillus silvestris]EKB45447.1 Oligopeptide transport system permease protein oppC [Solibacillus isronensis B3W22]BAK15014.1 ABC-type dipeptide/oligopeptide/nickel transport systems, permease component [Solibacillus silvestris StLB046]
MTLENKFNEQIAPERFEIVGARPSDADSLNKKQISFWQEVMYRFSHNKLAIIGLVILSFITIMAIFAPMFSSWSYEENTGLYNTAPSAAHWFGTDDLARDLFVRVWIGARISLFIGLAAAVIDLIIGVLWGSISGLLGGRVDNIMMRIADVLTAIPYLLVVIILLVVMEKGLIPMIIALSFTGWVNMARIVRAEVLSIKSREFVLASRTLGAGSWHLIKRHLIPNAMGAILVTMTLTIPAAIFTESFLSYIGLGVQQPLASWGTMASEGNKAIQSAPWRLMFPALFISLTIFAFNAVGDGLRDALDPKLRK